MKHDWVEWPHTASAHDLRLAVIALVRQIDPADLAAVERRLAECGIEPRGEYVPGRVTTFKLPNRSAK